MFNYQQQEGFFLNEGIYFFKSGSKICIGIGSQAEVTMNQPILITHMKALSFNYILS